MHESWQGAESLACSQTGASQRTRPGQNVIPLRVLANDGFRSLVQDDLAVLSRPKNCNPCVIEPIQGARLGRVVKSMGPFWPLVPPCATFYRGGPLISTACQTRPLTLAPGTQTVPDTTP